MELDAALAFSRYAERAQNAHPDLRDEIAATIDAPFVWTSAASAVEAAVAVDDATALVAALRALRRRVFVHTLARDLTGRAACRIGPPPVPVAIPSHQIGRAHV